MTHLVNIIFVQEHLLQALAPLQSGLVVVGDKCWARDDPLEIGVDEQHTQCALYPMQKVDYSLCSVYVLEHVNKHFACHMLIAHSLSMTCTTPLLHSPLRVAPAL